MKKSSNIVWHQARVLRRDREKINGHKSFVLWFTGLSGSGKSTLAHAVEESLHKMAMRTYVLDGDNVRHGLCGDLGFSDIARRENIRRIAEAARLFVDAGVIVHTAFISPFVADRTQARTLLGDDFIEIYCDSSLGVCESRDTKGLYQRARAGEIRDFTGISSPYEVPESAEIIVPTGTEDLHTCVEVVISYLDNHGFISTTED
jgi:adenylylsulfate kinase